MEGQIYRKKMNERHRQFGIKPCRLPESQLPTNGDVIGRLLMVRVEVMEERSITEERRVPMDHCIKQVTREVLSLWQRASLPTRSDQCVLKEVRKLWMKKENERKLGKKVRYRKTGCTDVSMGSLFDISNRKLHPELAADKAFLADQRRARRLHIGGRDHATTALWHRRCERQTRDDRKGAGINCHGSQTTVGICKSDASARVSGPASGAASHSGH